MFSLLSLTLFIFSICDPEQLQNSGIAALQVGRRDEDQEEEGNKEGETRGVHKGEERWEEARKARVNTELGVVEKGGGTRLRK